MKWVCSSRSSPGSSEHFTFSCSNEKLLLHVSLRSGLRSPVETCSSESFLCWLIAKISLINNVALNSKWIKCVTYLIQRRRMWRLIMSTAYRKRRRSLNSFKDTCHMFKEKFPSLSCSVLLDLTLWDGGWLNTLRVWNQTWFSIAWMAAH